MFTSTNTFATGVTGNGVVLFADTAVVTQSKTTSTALAVGGQSSGTEGLRLVSLWGIAFALIAIAISRWFFL